MVLVSISNAPLNTALQVLEGAEFRELLVVTEDPAINGGIDCKNG